MQPGGLPLGVFEPVSDLVLELSVLVENERAAAEDLDAQPARHVRWRVDVDGCLQFVDVQGQDLDVLGNGFVQDESVRTDAVARTHVLDLHVAVLLDLKRPAVFPDEPEHLLLVPQHRVEMAAAVDELPAALDPGALRSGAFRHPDVEFREVADEGIPVAVFRVVGDDFLVDCKQGREVVGERDVRCRAIVQRADRHREQMVGNARSLFDDQAPVLFPLLQESDLVETRDPYFDEGVHHRRDNQFAPPVRLEKLGHGHVFLARLELHRPAQSLSADARQLLSHFKCEPEQHRLLQRLRCQEFLVDQRRVAAGVEQRADDVLERKHGEEGDDVREPLVEGRLVRRRRFEISGSDAVEQRVRRLVRHDVVRKAGVDRTTGSTCEVAEKQPAVFLGIEGVRFRERVGRDVELVAVRSPRAAASECELEARENPHRYGVDILRVKFRVLEQGLVERGGDIRFAGTARLLRERIEVVAVPEFELGGVVEHVVRGVVVDDVDPVTARPGQKLLGGNLDFRRQDPPADPDRGVLCDDRQLPRVRKARQRSASGHHVQFPLFDPPPDRRPAPVRHIFSSISSVAPSANVRASVLFGKWKSRHADRNAEISRLHVGTYGRVAHRVAPVHQLVLHGAVHCFQPGGNLGEIVGIAAGASQRIVGELVVREMGPDAPVATRAFAGNVRVRSGSAS